MLSIAPGSPRPFGADTSTEHNRQSTLCALTLFFLTACLPLSSQYPKKSTAPDQKAFSAARKIFDPQQKIDTLRKFVAHYPKSTRVASANELIFETLVKDFPSRINEIQKQIGIALRHSKSDYYAYDDIAGTLADHDILLQQAQALSQKSLMILKEPQFAKAMEKDYSQAKMEAPDRAEIHREFVKAHASFEATLGRIYVKVGNLGEGERLLSEAYGADPNDSVAAAILGDCAVKAGHDDAALKYFVRARLTGKLTADQQTSLEAVYSKSHGGSAAGIEEFLDEEYETTFPIPFAIDRYRASPERSNRTVLAELFTGAGCDPCTGADIAIEADLKRYSRQELAVLTFHQHISEPDPLTNPASVQRFAFYDASGTPTIAVDGTTKIVGAPRDRAKSAFDEIGTMIDKDLELPGGGIAEPYGTP